MSTIFGISGISIDLLSGLGNVRISNTVRKFHEDLKVLLETKKGTMIGDPEFGSNLFTLLYEPANEYTAAKIRQEVVIAVEKYYPQVVIDQIDVVYKPHTVQLSILYRMFNTNIKDTVMLEFIRGELR